MLGIGGRLAAVAVATQVGNHQRELLRETRRDLMPYNVILRISMDEQHRRAAAALHQVDFRARSFDALLGESFEHRWTSWIRIAITVCAENNQPEYPAKNPGKTPRHQGGISGSRVLGA